MTKMIRISLPSGDAYLNPFQVVSVTEAMGTSGSVIHLGDGGTLQSEKSAFDVSQEVQAALTESP